MSKDLISRSKLLEVLNHNRKIHTDQHGETRQLVAIDINRMIEYVEKMPAAYDVEAVSQQLLECAERGDKTAEIYATNNFAAKSEKYTYGANCYREAAELVRKGGANNGN